MYKGKLSKTKLTFLALGGTNVREENVGFCGVGEKCFKFDEKMIIIENMKKKNYIFSQYVR